MRHDGGPGHFSQTRPFLVMLLVFSNALMVLKMVILLTVTLNILVISAGDFPVRNALRTSVHFSTKTIFALKKVILL